MNKEELKALCVEWYIKHGEKLGLLEDAYLPREPEDTLIAHSCLIWPTKDITKVKLTRKALRIINS